jgi:hypothetical protein
MDGHYPKGEDMTLQKESLDSALLARLEQKIDSIDNKVEDMNKKLYGNGHPGIIVDQALQNRQIEDLLEKEKKNCENIKALIESNPNKWLAKNWIKIIMIATGFFVLLHSLMPEGATIWQLLSLIK